MNGKGWVRLHRKFKDHWLWKQRRRFSKWEAWEDLFTEANYKENKVPKGNSLIVVKRGQLITSQLKLAKRWCWHRETVSNFLKLLKSDEMLDITTVKGYDIGYTLITILNYNELQNNDVDTSDITPSIDNQHYSGITTSNNNKDRKSKNKRWTPKGCGSNSGISLLGEPEGGFIPPYLRKKEERDGKTKSVSGS